MEYILLETNDMFLCHDAGAFAFIGDETIFIFDKIGNAKARINRKGQGVEEFVAIDNKQSYLSIPAFQLKEATITEH